MKHIFSLTVLLFMCTLGAKPNTTKKLERATQDTVSGLIFNALEEWDSMNHNEQLIWEELQEKPHLDKDAFYEFCDNQLPGVLDFVLQEKRRRCEQETNVNARLAEERDYNLYTQQFDYFKSLRTSPPETRYPFYERIRLELPRDLDNQGAIVFGENS